VSTADGNNARIYPSSVFANIF